MGNLIDTGIEASTVNKDINEDLAGLQLSCGDAPANFGSFMPSQLLQVYIYYHTHIIKHCIVFNNLLNFRCKIL